MGLFGKRDKPTYTLFFASDLHGSDKCFRKFLRAREFYGVDALVLGGDLTGKVMVPIVDSGGNEFTADFMDRRVSVTGGKELEDLERSIRFNGYYVHHCGAEEVQRLSGDDDFQAEVFNGVMRADLVRWMKEAEARFADDPVPITGIPGNDDHDYVSEVLSEAKAIENGEDGIVELGPFQVLSCGYSNPTPWNSPREVSETELEEKLDAAAQGLEPGRPTVFNVHVPPFNTGLDMAPELDPDMKIRGGAAANMTAVGSTAVKAAIEKYQPVVSLHGHVHESRGSARLNQTVALNPGSEYNAGVLRGVIVRFAEDGHVISHQFVAA